MGRMDASVITEVHGHRGCGGDVPANTIPAFLRATTAGCHWLEMDVVITGDNEVLVSHEPWMDHTTCLGPDGKPITEAEGRALNMYNMPLSAVQQYRVKAPAGNATARKPTLAEVVQAVGVCVLETGKASPKFNIEVKSDPQQYGTYQPLPAALAARVLEEITRSGLIDRCLIQCFDPAVLEELHRLAPAIPLAFLVEGAHDLSTALGHLRFTPAYYSPSFRQVDEALVAALRERNIGLLTWTVNEEADMRRMIALGVNGLITDEPAKALALLGPSQ